MPTITGKIYDQVGAPSTAVDVLIRPANAGHVVAAGANVELGAHRWSGTSVPDPITLEAGVWVVVVSTTQRVNRELLFPPQSFVIDLTTVETISWAAIYDGVAAFEPGTIDTTDQAIAAKVIDPASATSDALSATYVPQLDSSTTDKRFFSRWAPTFSPAFVFSKIAPNQDGALVWKNMTVSAGSASVAEAGGAPSYFKAVGGNVIHDGPGNLDIFWASVAHTGPREAGLFIGDITSSGGGNNYGIHTRNIQDTVAPAQILVGYECELIPNVARGSAQYYNILVQNSGSHPVSAGIQIESPATGGGGKFDKGINFDSTAASVTATGIFMGGVWGAGIDMNNNALVGVGSISGNGASGSRFVRVADFLTLDNTRSIGFRDSAGTRRDTLSLSGSDDVYFILGKAAGGFYFRDMGNTSTLARITSSGRADFSTGGVTTKYVSGAAAPARVTDGHLHVWHDTGSGTAYLVVDVNGVQKKVALA